MFENRRWLIIPASEVENVDFNQVLQKSADTLRYSVDGTQALIKYNVNVIEEAIVQEETDPETGETISINIPAGVYGRPSVYNSEYPEYTYAEIHAVLSGSDWMAQESLEDLPE